MPVLNYSVNQLPPLLDFIERRRAWTSQGRNLGRQTFQEILVQPGLDPEANCFLLEENGDLQGFCMVTPEIPIGRAVVELEVAPRLEGAPGARELVRRAVERARELGARVAHMCLPHPSPTTELLAEEGFTLARTYWDMVWRQRELASAELPTGFAVRPYHNGDAPVVTQVQNDAFEGSWGFCPNTVEQIEYRSGMANTSHQGILLLSEDDRAAGYCWTCLVPVENGTKGIIGMIGVVPDYRGRGISRPILLEGMKYLRSIDVTEIALQVDGSNAPAIGLYTSVGFEKAGESQWFGRELP